MTLIAVLAGILVVLVGILAFRLHAVLALLAGAVATALLTSPTTRTTDALDRVGSAIESIDANRVDFADEVANKHSYTVIAETADGDIREAGLFVTEAAAGDVKKVSGPLDGDYRPHSSNADENARRWLVPTTSVSSLKDSLGRSLGARLAFGFGRTAGKIGLIIALAAVIGQALLHSGAADRIVRSTFSFTGEKGAPAAFVVSGFVLGIPVFFDTVFYLMIPLGKALYARTKRNYLTYVLTIICGGTMAHSLVPPTPGPLLVATELNVPIAKMIGYGCTVGLVTATVGYFYACFIGSKFELTPKENIDAPPEQNTDDLPSPSVGLSLLPIILPLALITIASLLKASKATEVMGYDLIQAFGDKNIALLIAAAISLLMLLKWNRSGRPVTELVSEALTSGAMIVLITGAGGAFGSILQESGLRGLVEDLPPMSTPMLLTIAFAITTAIRTAQGSATVAMITAVALFADLATSGTLPCDPVYLALAIGCGSKPFAWMADSGFWVITRMSGMTPGEGLKYITPMTGFMGLAGLLATIAMASVMPGV